MWIRVGSQAVFHPLAPADTLVIACGFAVRFHYLIVAAYAYEGVPIPIVVTDNLPSGGSTYVDGGVQGWLDGTGACGYSWTVATAGSPHWRVTYRTLDTSLVTWGAVVAVYRSFRPVSIEGGVQGRPVGTVVGGVPFGVAPTDDVVWMHAAIEDPAAVLTPVAPLAPLVAGPLGTTGRYVYADAFPVVGAVSPQMNLGAGAAGAYQAASFLATAPPPPPPRVPGGFASGGIQPAPVYRKEEDRYLRRQWHRAYSEYLYK